jgi:adenosylcobinamide-phosphate synthase
MFGLSHNEMNGVVILSAAVMDLVLGDPRRLPHPVRAIGLLINKCETILRRSVRSPRAEKAAGVVLAVLVISAAYFASQILILTAFRYSLFLGFFVSTLIGYTTLAARDLSDSARTVLSGLDAGDIASARKDLAMIVGRDTAHLDEKEIVRAVVETVAENASDGVVAPLFYLAIGGPALALAYKAVNTLDSMVGYKNERYLHFGWAAARLDDLANYIPARITGILIALSTGLASRSLLSVRASFAMMLRDGRNHPSPNSGYPEAAMAGALGIRLGGPSTYTGQPGGKPYIGDPKSPMEKKYIEKSIELMYCSTLLAALGGSAVLFYL